MHPFTSIGLRSLIASAFALTGPSLWACDLQVESAWIREAPPNATVLAGYAVLKNAGDKPLSIISIDSPAFTAVEPHETATTNGVASMHAMATLILAAGDKVEFAPGGKHLMLVNPKQMLKKGDSVTLKLKDDRGCITTTSFKVSAMPMTDNVEKMDHSQMNHGT